MFEYFCGHFCIWVRIGGLQKTLFPPIHTEVLNAFKDVRLSHIYTGYVFEGLFCIWALQRREKSRDCLSLSTGSVLAVSTVNNSDF